MMITPDEIRQTAERKYLAFLRASVQGEPFFPLVIRFRKAKASDDYLALRQWVGELLAGSKAERGFGLRYDEPQIRLRLLDEGLRRELGRLADCAIWYWGDLDAQGFAILSQVRGYWPQTCSFLMDAGTLERYRQFVVTGTPVAEVALVNLERKETAVYRRLVTHNWRLEQERINQADVVAATGHL